MYRKMKSSFIGGDHDGHAGTTSIVFEGSRCMKALGMARETLRVKAILDFVVPYNLLVANTFFRKRQSH
jgi:hypothetical protein